MENSVARLLAEYFKDETNLFVISSDLLHWGKAYKYTQFDDESVSIDEYIRKLDA
jgi:predicted class III extradiol MEMO1 family dioxygenase